MLAKYSIRAKIITLVALLLVAMTAMGLLAVSNMRGINANTVDIATSWLPSVRVLGELQQGVIMNRNIVRAHLLADTLDDKLKVEAALNANFEAVAKSIQAYQPLITSPEERALYSEWAQIWDEYKRGVDEVLALSRKEAGQVPRQANELNSRKVNKILTDADVILKKDIELNNRGADRAFRDAGDSYSSALVMVAVILTFALVAGIALSLYMVKDISDGIASIVKPMQALGEGDLAAEVPHQGDKTEIGAMADALQIFKEALIAKKAADETAARDAEAKIERGRRVDNITREFETMIGEIVNTCLLYTSDAADE